MKIVEFYKPKISMGVDAATQTFLNKNSIATWYDKRTKLYTKLEQLGWTTLGTGAFSSVFKNKNKNYVLKINTQGDKGYAAYVNLIKKFKNPHFPIISDMKLMKLSEYDAPYYIYLIEKLEPLQNWKIANILKIIADHCYEELTDLEDIVHIPEYVKNDESLVQAARLVGEYKNKAFLDMHSGNFMQRKDGTIVITDPYIG